MRTQPPPNPLFSNPRFARSSRQAHNQSKPLGNHGQGIKYSSEAMQNVQVTSFIFAIATWEKLNSIPKLIL